MCKKLTKKYQGFLYSEYSIFQKNNRFTEIEKVYTKNLSNIENRKVPYRIKF